MRTSTLLTAYSCCIQRFFNCQMCAACVRPVCTRVCVCVRVCLCVQHICTLSTYVHTYSMLIEIDRTTLCHPLSQVFLLFWINLHRNHLSRYTAVQIAPHPLWTSVKQNNNNNNYSVVLVNVFLVFSFAFVNLVDGRVLAEFKFFAADNAPATTTGDRKKKQLKSKGREFHFKSWPSKRVRAK